MKTYLFEDAKFADRLRELGFSVIQSGSGAKKKFCVPENEELIKLLRTQFADVAFTVSDVLFF